MQAYIPQYQTPLQPQAKNNCLHTLGSVCSVFYIIQQLIFIGIIVASVANPVNVLFGFTTWTLLSFQAAFNLIIAFIVKCAYAFDPSSWTRFKPFLTFVLGINLAIHLAVPLVLMVLMFVNADEEKKAYYETMATIFAAGYAIDFSGFLWMTVPYYWMYSGNEYQMLTLI